MPDEIAGVLEGLTKRERVFEQDPEIPKSAEDIIQKGLPGDSISNYPVNVIPGDTPGKCRDVLIVAVGSAQQSKYEYVDRRILQAIEHVYAKCPQDTKFVIFWTENWDTTTWRNHVDSFKGKGVTVVLKLFGHYPKLLA